MRGEIIFILIIGARFIVKFLGVNKKVGDKIIVLRQNFMLILFESSRSETSQEIYKRRKF